MYENFKINIIFLLYHSYILSDVRSKVFHSAKAFFNGVNFVFLAPKNPKLSSLRVHFFQTNNINSKHPNSSMSSLNERNIHIFVRKKWKKERLEQKKLILDLKEMDPKITFSLSFETKTNLLDIP